MKRSQGRKKKRIEKGKIVIRRELSGEGRGSVAAQEDSDEGRPRGGNSDGNSGAARADLGDTPPASMKVSAVGTVGCRFCFVS